ncbi:MAG: acetate kinase, partial [Candidatus Brocadiae bacterium]|nr:acetate kinase [Candidatus Brocadiia bacterium]
MKILVINAGSSSLKCTLFQMPERRALADGVVEKIGEGDAFLSFSAGATEVRQSCEAADHPAALQALVGCLLDEQSGVLTDLNEIAAVGHRVVHGGETSHSALIDEGTLQVIRENSVLAPLHNPPNLAGVEAALHMMPGRPQVAVFDTAFHTSMPPRAYLYAIPYSLYTERHVRAYGFH